MPSNIDFSKPVYGTPTTQSVRDNFQIAQVEITDLQNITAEGPFLPTAGGIMEGPLTLARDPAGNFEAATKSYVDNLAFGGGAIGIPEAPKDGMFYSRGGTVGGNNDWYSHPQYTALKIGPDINNIYFGIRSDATYNFYDLLNDGNNLLRFDRTNKFLEFLVNGNPIVGISDTAITLHRTLTLNADPVNLLEAATKQYADNIITTTATAASHNAGRNILNNSTCNVAQRGNGPFIGGGWTLDRWNLTLNLDTVNVTRQAATDADRTAVGDESFTSYIQNVFTGNVGVTSYNYITQAIDDIWRTAGKTITVSFWAKTPSGTLKIGINSMQGFGVGGSPSPAAWALATGLSVTVDTAWKRYQVTYPMPSVIGKTIGSGGGSVCGVSFFFSGGTGIGPTAGNIGVQSGTIQMWGMQLEIGSVMTPLEKIDFGLDLKNCQRYYQVGSVAHGGYQLTGWGVQQSFALFGSMYKNPIVAITAETTNINCQGITLSTGSGPGLVSNIVLQLGVIATGAFAYSANYTASAEI